MIHIDLFAGIGGNSLAFDTVFHEQKNTHIFCEIEPYPRAVLRKLWPDATIVSDVRTFTADAGGVGHIHRRPEKLAAKGPHQAQRQSAAGADSPFILTGGFPCQPFSQAGRRKGTADDRYLWPAMLRVIQDWRPAWVIAENVRGLVTWNDGMVLETVCADLEREGYEVQPLIIPAVAVGAPHRRDRIWFVANYRGTGLEKKRTKQSSAGSGRGDSDASNSISARLEGRSECQEEASEDTSGKERTHGMSRQLCSVSNLSEWHYDWHEVAAELCGMDDGLPAELDGSKLSASAHRKARLKALGNAIVPQVAMEIMNAIKMTM